MKEFLFYNSGGNVKLKQTLERKTCPGPYNATIYATFANYADQCTCISAGDICQSESSIKFCNCGDGLHCDSNSNECVVDTIEASPGGQTQLPNPVHADENYIGYNIKFSDGEINFVRISGMFPENKFSTKNIKRLRKR